MFPVLPLFLLSACRPEVEKAGGDCPDLRFAPEALSYGEVRRGDSVAQSVTVANDCSGGDDLELSASLTGTGFALESIAWTIPPGEEIEVVVLYMPDDGEPDTGVLHLGSNDAGRSTVEVALSGSSYIDDDQDGWRVDQDCDDLDPEAWPGAEELWYDGIDQDCAGGSDYDQDGDGQDAAEHGGEDCDDLDPEAWLGAAEQWYDGQDQDCLGGDDDDQDGDGHAALAHGGDDCLDTDPSIHPGADETWYDGIDQDCSGGSDQDQDGDGHVVLTAGGDDCDDRDAEVHPDAEETWYDGVDQDCGGEDDYDQDGDGFQVYPTGDDCDDMDPEVTAGSEEIRDGADNDCDGDVDEGLAQWGDLVLTEIMANPSRVADSFGEWFELTSTLAWDIDLEGWEVEGASGEGFVLAGSLVVPAGGTVVLGVDADEARNGGVTVDLDYELTDLALGDSGDTLELHAPEGTLVTGLVYTAAWGMRAGASLSLDPTLLDADSATLAASWCAASSSFGDGDLGTPGADNDLCDSVDHDGDGELAGEGDCDDFDAGVSTGAEEVDDGIDQDCDGAVDEISAPVSDLPYLDGVGSYWDLSVQGVADADRDGVADLFYVSLSNDTLYTAPVDDWTSWSGAHNLYGSQEIPALTTALVGCCTYAEEVVDLTGDDRADYLIGGYNASGNPQLYLFEGPVAGHSSGGDYDVSIQASGITGSQPLPTVGPDLDGDGVSELLVGSPTATWSSRSRAGYLGIYKLEGLVGSTVTRDSAELLLTGGAANDGLGGDVAAADWNGDGFTDLAIAGEETIWLLPGDGLETTGEAEVGDLADASIQWDGAVDLALLLVDEAGDDTRALVAAGGSLARWADVGSLTGASIVDEADARVLGEGDWTPVLGQEPADVDGDGRQEVLLSADGSDLTWLYGLGAEDWPTGEGSLSELTLLWELARAGASWGGAYDMDGDGVDELVLRHPGHSSTGRSWIVSF